MKKMQFNNYVLSGFIIFMMSISVKASTLSSIYDNLIKIGDPAKKYDNILYSYTTNNWINNDFLIQLPTDKIWGMPAKDYVAYNFDKSADPNFGLKHCNKNSDCSGGSCEHLAAFYDGRNGADTKMCVSSADHTVDRIYNAIISAKRFVDINTLSPLPDGRFLAAILNAIAYLGHTGRPVKIRMLAGAYQPILHSQYAYGTSLPNDFVGNAHAIIEKIANRLKNIPNSKVSVYVALSRTCIGVPFSECAKNSPSEMMSFSWNHSKIINVDGQEMLEGGFNLFTKEYLEPKPIFDLIMQVRGDVAAKSTAFTNALWGNLKRHIHDPIMTVEYGYENGIITKSLLPDTFKPAPITPPKKVDMNNVPMLAIGRSGGGLLPGSEQENLSDLGLYLMLNSAKKTIYLAQQSLNLPDWPYDTIKGKKHTNLISALAHLIINKGQVYIVMSPYSIFLAAAGYNSQATPKEIWKKIEDETRAIAPNSDINSLLCKHLNLTTIRFNQHDNTWADGSKIYSHYKFFMVDGQMFYVGSQNFYPENHQDYGIIVDDPAAASLVKSNLWDKVWNASSHARYIPDSCKIN